MGKKKKASSRSQRPAEPTEQDLGNARLGPINTYEDVADSEDEFFLDRDKVMLEDEPKSKRLRGNADIELSDEEVLGYSEDNSGEEEDSEAEKTISHSRNADEAADQEEEEEEQESGWWGSTKGEYYNADKIETEADAEEEEAEAKRLQRKKLSKMAEEDFIFDGDEWTAAETDPADDHETVTEILQDIEIPEDMGPAERLRILQARYPEFGYLVAEYQDLQPLLAELQTKYQRSENSSLAAIQYWTLGCYVASLAGYFAILTSPARDSPKVQKPLDPSDLRDHEVMATLVRCRDIWRRVRYLTAPGSAKQSDSLSVDIPVARNEYIDEETPIKVKNKSSKKDKATTEKSARKLEQARVAEAAVADLYELPLRRPKKSKQIQAVTKSHQDADSDFGEEEALDTRTAAEKESRKKSLKFYTSQIVQKANKRAGAGRDAGGDMDIPYRERLRDRQARLLSQAEKRGQKDSKHGTLLGEDSDEEDSRAATSLRDNEDEYYDMVAQASRDKKSEKTARYAAYAAASKADRVVETEEIGEDGKRKINYAIEKNKGLAPKRNKDNRNPRVKKRKQFEAKKKKLSSMMPTWKGGEPKGGYHGEVTGINPGVVKSIKL